MDASTSTTMDTTTENIQSRRYQEGTLLVIALDIFVELYTVLAVVCAAVDILIAVVIIRYKNLRQVKYSVILLNWTIVNSLFMIFSAFIVRHFFEHLTISPMMSRETYCFLHQLNFTLLLTNLLMIILLTVYWYLELHYPNVFGKFVRHLCFFLCSVYVLIACCLGLHVDACYNNRAYTLSEAIIVLSFIIYILFMVVINIVHAVKKRRLTLDNNVKNIPFILSNIYFYSHLALLLSVCVAPFLHRMLIAEFLVGICVIFSMMNVVYFVVTLYKYDRHYNVYLRNIFLCRCFKHNADELLEQGVAYQNDVAQTMLQ